MIVVGTDALRITSTKLIRDAWAQAGEQAIGFVKNTSEQLAAIINSTASPKEMRGRLKQIIDSSVDVDDVARFCLGRFWRLATPDQQKQYMALFHDLLEMKITDHLGEYRGATVTTGLARKSADTQIVNTTVRRPRMPIRQVDWVISTSTGTPKVVDLIASGTSLRSTQSEDFISYLAHHNYSIQDLIDAMHQMLERTSDVRP